MRNKRTKQPKERFMQVMGGYLLDMHNSGHLVAPKVIAHVPGKDYGADPLGDGTFRMVPSGDIVDFEERNRRLLR